MEDQKFEVTGFGSDTEKEYKEGDVVVTGCGSCSCDSKLTRSECGTAVAFSLPD